MSAATNSSRTCSTLAAIRERQERHLRQELDRIGNYFAGYEAELSQRRARGDEAAARKDQRLAAARAERDRQRLDQFARQAVRLVPRLDGLLLVAESAWRATVETVHHRASHACAAVFVPRNRRWHLAEREGSGEPGRPGSPA